MFKRVSFGTEKIFFVDGNLCGDITIKYENQVKIKENVYYNASTSSRKEEEDFGVLLVIGEYTVHV